jgi:uncharacterized protein YkwD
MDFIRQLIFLSLVILVIFGCGCKSSVVEYEMEHQVLQEVNRYRVTKGLQELTGDERIAEIARNHSLEMSNDMVKVGHQGASHRFEKVAKKGLSWVSAAENIAFLSKYRDPVKEVVAEWIKSSKGYRQNMEGNFNLTGIGVIKSRSGAYYFTQIFIKTHNKHYRIEPGKMPVN